MTDPSDHRDSRREYDSATLSRRALPADPLTLFSRWLNQAAEAGAKDATAMALATADRHGIPSVRIVLLKEFGPDGFVWFTEYGSQKGRELAENPTASAVFYWRDFDHQVRVTGPVSKLERARSSEYFASRPLESRLSAAASRQSRPVADRHSLEARVQVLRKRFPDGDIPMPEHWGGYCLLPDSYEFWQGREGRLHDRFRYSRRAEDGLDRWEIERLQP